MGNTDNDSMRTSELDGEFLSDAKLRLERLDAHMRDLDSRLAALQSDRSRTAALIRHLRGLLNVHQGEEEKGPVSQALPLGVGGTSRGEDADRVVKYLRMRNEATHYRRIYEDLNKQGIVAGGKDPALTFLARYYNDSRLTRVGRGTYVVKT